MLAATGCFWGDESETRHLVGYYYLNGVSDEDPWYLYFDEEGGLADALINSRIAEAGVAQKCIVLRAAGPGSQFYIVPLSIASDKETREAARSKIIGPLSKTEFQAAVRRLNNGVLVPFDPELTSF